MINSYNRNLWRARNSCCIGHKQSVAILESVAGPCPSEIQCMYLYCLANLA